MRFLKYYLTLLPLLFYSFGIQAQLNNGESSSIIYSTNETTSYTDTSAHFIIKQITIEGNRKTQVKIILRELSFKENEQYPLSILVKKFAQAKKQLMNTTLFQEVVVSLNGIQGDDASVLISVRERWYIFPIPFVKVVDRSVQDWVKNQNMDLKRVKYGIKFKHKNFTGHNDKLEVNLGNGYTKQVALRYSSLPMDKNLRWSSNFSIAYGRNRDINYATADNRQVTYKKSDRFVHTFFNSSLEFSYRPAIKTKHTFGIGYNFENVNDTVFKLSPAFSFQKNKIRYPKLFYQVQYFDVDFIPYPTKGYAADVLLEKKGFSKQLNLWQLTARSSATWPLSSKYFFNLRLTGLIKLPFKQPYITQGFVGQNNFYLQGYEDYIIDGVAGGFTKASFSRTLINTKICIASKKIKRLNDFPLRVYGKVYANTGYIYNQHRNTNTLNNALLYSGGIGFDVVLFYDFIFKLEWSFNSLKQNGLYLHDRGYL
jgi:outer membrane protein assembly factor BamA